MYLKRIVLKNIRGFEHLDFDLQRPDGSYAGWTVFTGDNGAGKSALLKAIAVGMMAEDHGFLPLQPSFSGWLRSGAATYGRSENEYSGDKSPSIVATTILMLYANEPRPRTVWSKPSWKSQDFFFCGYGSFRRAIGTTEDAQRLLDISGPIGRLVTLFREDAALTKSEPWLRNLHHRQLENRNGSGETLDAIIAFLNDELLKNGFRVQRVDSDGLWLRDHAGTMLRLRDLSDGYQSLLTLLLDILRHLVTEFDTKPLFHTGKDGHLHVSASGVILIDEVDSHLHPSWQREIGFWLKRHFPNMQFLVTSHSPLICQAADAGGLFHLPAPGSGGVPAQVPEETRLRLIRGGADFILGSAAFGLTHIHSPPVVAAQEEYSELAAKKMGPGLNAKEKLRARNLLPMARWAENDDWPEGTTLSAPSNVAEAALRESVDDYGAEASKPTPRRQRRASK